MRRKAMKSPGHMTVCFFLVMWLLAICIVWADNTALFDRGNDLLMKGEYLEALNLYESFIKKNPGHRLTAAAMWTVANIHMTISENYATAAECFGRIAAKYADTEWQVYAYDRWGFCLEEQQKWQEAAEVYKTAVLQLSTSAGDATAQARIDRFKRSLLSNYRNMSDYESIISVYEESLAESPTAESAPEYQFNLAQTYLDINDSKAAAENFVLVVERYPVTIYAQRVYNEHAEFVTSELDYDWTPFAKFQSALEFNQTGQYNKALPLFKEVIKIKEHTGMADAARFQMQLIKFRENGDAQALLDEISRTRDDYQFGYGGVSVNQLSFILRGIVETQETIKSNPEDVGAYAGMAYAYYRTRAYLCGIEAYNNAIAIEPDNQDLYNMLGYCYIGMQSFDDAIVTFQQLIGIAPDDPNSYDSYAEAHYMSGDTVRAIEFYQKSLSVDSNFTHPYYMLGRIYFEQGQNQKAVEHLERYLELDPGGYRAQSARSLLEQINRIEINEDE